MAVAEKIIPNLYRDSVALMQLSARVAATPGVTRAVAVMATRANLALLAEAGFARRTLEPHPNDVLVVIEGDDEACVATALGEMEASLRSSLAAGEGEAGEGAGAVRPTSIAMALEESPANLALISTPGEYAAAEAEKALRLGLNVMLFSSNVAIEDEVRLKNFAREQNLLVMGPDCGTAIINGVPLGFANVLRRGPIGVVAAAGTGLQEVASLIDRAGSGISQAIGTGGRDLSDAVGGATMRQALAALAADKATEIIVLVSKPPSPKVAATLRREAAACGKPVVICFLGADLSKLGGDNLHAAETLEDAAHLAHKLARGDAAMKPAAAPAPTPPRFAPTQKYVRGLFSGGTLCYEALVLLAQELGPVWSNTPLDPAYALADPWTSRAHTVIDLGAEIFTRGRPHPMIDPLLRSERLVKEAADAETAIILFDVVLGHGAHPDPAASLATAIAAARRHQDREVAFVASICGTKADPQNFDAQHATLRDAGVLVAPSNAAAARLAAAIARAQR